MKLNPAAPTINVKSISRQTEAQNKSSKNLNQANKAFYSADLEKKAEATRQLSQAKSSAGAQKLATYNQRLENIKATTAQLNQKTRESGTEANVLMAKVISPPGSKLQPSQLGKFIDHYA